MSDYAALLPFCKSDRQREVITALVANGTQEKGARELNVSLRNFAGVVARVKLSAAARGHAPEHDMTKTAPEGYAVKGTSTLYDAETGEPKIQWVKTQADQTAQLLAFQDALLETFADITPLPAIRAPKVASKDLLAVIPLGDPHLGMYAWKMESGEDFDTDMAAEQLRSAVDRLVHTAPSSGTAILNNLGDFFHADNVDNRTRRSGNVLDVDTRWARVLRIGVDTMIHLVRRMLETHKRVVVRNNIGNHDEHSSIMLSIAMDAFFKDNKRVHIDTSPDPFWYYRHGEVLIGTTHGDRTKPAALPQIMATDRPLDWGETKYRYWYTGHIHHQSRHEFPGVQVESFRTLASGDAWHHGQGYRSGRDMHCIVHHRRQGDLERHRVGIEQL